MLTQLSLILKKYKFIKHLVLNILVFIVFFSFPLYLFHKKQSNVDIQDKCLNLNRLYSSLVLNAISQMNIILDCIVKEPEINSILSADLSGDKFKNVFSPIFNLINSAVLISDIFYIKDQEVFSLKNREYPPKYSVYLKTDINPEFLKQSCNISFDKTGHVFFETILPYKKNNKIDGFIGIQKDFNDLRKNLDPELKIDFFLEILNSFKSEYNPESIRESIPNLFEESVIVSTSSDTLLKKLKNIRIKEKTASISKKIKIKNSYYFWQRLPLYNYKGEEFARINLFHDISSHEKDLEKYKTTLIISTIIAWSILVLFYHLYFKKLYFKLNLTEETLKEKTTAHFRVQHALVETEERYKIMIDNLSLGVFKESGRLDDRFLDTNIAMFNIFGYDNKKEFMQIPISKIFKNSADREKFIDDIQETGICRNAVFELKKKDGSYIWGEFNAKLVYDSDQNLYIEGILNDITEQKKAKDELMKMQRGLEFANAELEKAVEVAHTMAIEASRANTAKTTFLANMSHEIRTPINGILGFLNLFKNTPLSHEQTEYINNALISTHSLLSLINDILDFTKIESGRMELESIPFNPVSIIESSAKSLASTAHEKDLEILSYVDPNLHFNLIGDPNRFKQIIINLLGNAIKFTQIGEIFISSSIIRDSDDTVVVQTKVTDTGIGISQNHIQRLFHVFSQVDPSTHRKYGGSGLGLAISKRFIDLMGGEISVESIEGQGTTFTFSIPFRKVLGDNKKSQTIEKINNCDILILTNNNSVRNLLKAYINFMGCPATIFSSQEEIKTHIQNNRLNSNRNNLLIVDEPVNDKSYLDSIDDITRNTNIKSLFLLYSNSKRLQTITAANVIHRHLYLIKPLNFLDLYKIISSNKPETVFSPLKNIKTETVIKEKLYKDINILVAEDNKINLKLIVILLRKFGFNVVAVENGKLAYDAFLKSDFNAIIMDCHMPEMDGYEATKQIRNTEKGRDIPIIALTANVMKENINKCLEAGMNECLGKPIDPELVFNTLKFFLHI